MTLTIYGGGCTNCKKLLEATKSAVATLGIDATVEYVTDMPTIMAKGFLTMPVLEQDDTVLSKGKVLNAKQVAELIQQG